MLDFFPSPQVYALIRNFLKTQKGISGMQLSLEEFENGVFFLLFKSDKGTMVKRIIRS
jgi:hypothetical protein